MNSKTEYIDINKAAEFCHTTVHTLRRKIKSGKIRPIMPFGKYLFTEKQLQDYLLSTRKVTTKRRLI
ncbi:MAG: helix-turn-helix domain-containing protein [Candidatus Cloacimonetes bacterium]|nr:helix-turn-helix domain-containing protein [Candidatus Cloacimonadota bacterium]